LISSLLSPPVSLSLEHGVYRKSSLVHPYTIAFRKPCKGVVRDWPRDGEGERRRVESLRRERWRLW